MTPRRTPIDRMGQAWKRLDAGLLRWGWAPTAEGLLWFVLSALIMVQGLSRGFNLVTFIAAFLLSMWLINMLVAALAGKRLKQLEIRRRLHGLVHAGSPVYASLEVRHPGYSRINGLRLEDRGSEHEHSIGLSILEPQQTQEIKYPLIPQARGYYRWEPLRVSTGYPFGLARRAVTLPAHERESVVMPMLGQFDQPRFQQWLRHSRRANSLQTRERARRSVAPADFYGIRNYRAGDSARWIHWRTTARVGTPMVREFEEPPQDQIMVILEAWLPVEELKLRQDWWQLHEQLLAKLKKEYRQYGKPGDQEHAQDLEELRVQERSVTKPLDLVEQAISLASTMCFAWTRRLGSNITLGIADGANGLPVILESGPTIRQLMPLLERLAVVQATPQPDIGTLVQGVQQRGSRSGSILLISTRHSPLAATLSHALNRPVQLLDVSKQDMVRRFFTSAARAV